MPAVSKAQQAAAGIAHAVEKGELPKSKLRGASKRMFQSMHGTGELKKFAKTKTGGLPQKKTEEGQMTARMMFHRERISEGRDDAPKLGLGRTGLKFARMQSKEAMKPAKGGQSDAKWQTSLKLRAGLAGEKPSAKMASKDAVGKVQHAFKESRAQALVDKLLGLERENNQANNADNPGDSRAEAEKAS